MEEASSHNVDADSDLQNGTEIKRELNQISIVNLSGKSLLKRKNQVSSSCRKKRSLSHSHATRSKITINEKDVDDKELVQRFTKDNENILLNDSYAENPKGNSHAGEMDHKREPCEDETGIDVGFSSDQTAQWIRDIIQNEELDGKVLKLKEEINDFYSCPICPMVFSNNVSLEFHIQSQHDDEAWKQDLEGSFKIEVNNLEEDQLDSVAGENSVICMNHSDADDTSKTDCNSSMNRKKRPRQKPYKCAECEKTFTKKKDLQLHTTIHTGDSPFKCKDCNQCFMRGKDLKMHVRIHTGERLFICKECNQCFKTKWNLNTHVRLHSGEKPFICNDCPQSFNTKWNLRIHTDRRHSGKKPYQCTKCDQNFYCKRDLHSHITTHTGENLFKCSQCDKTFNSKSNLVSHMRTHTGERPFKCHECDKNFSLSGHLQSHMRKHSGDAPFSCGKCDKSFSDQGNLQRHLRTHTGEMPFQCSKCDKNFSDLSNLNRHMITHTGEKPFMCNECSQVFTTKWNLSTHMKRHTGEKPFICTECNHGFYTKGNLLIHMKRRHSKEKITLVS